MSHTGDVFPVCCVVVSEVAVPSFIVVNLSTDGYFLPPGTMETEQHFVDFLDGILDGSIQVSPSDSPGGQQRRFEISV